MGAAEDGFCRNAEVVVLGGVHNAKEGILRVMPGEIADWGSNAQVELKDAQPVYVPLSRLRLVAVPAAETAAS